MKIWTYGCSFTSGYNELQFTDEVWTNKLTLNQPYSLKNRAQGGGGFHDVRRHLLRDIGEINSDDLIIIQLPTSNRVCIPYFQTEWDSFMRIVNEHPEGTIGWLHYLKDRDDLIDALAEEAIVLFELLNRLKLKWMWWSSERTSHLLDKFDYNRLILEEYFSYEDWIWNNRQYWIKEDDWHQNIEGHNKLANIFSKQISTFLGGGFSSSSTKSPRANLNI